MNYHEYFKSCQPVVPFGTEYRRLVTALLWTDVADKLERQIEYLQYEYVEEVAVVFLGEKAPPPTELHHFYFRYSRVEGEHQEYFLRQTLRFGNNSQPETDTVLYCDRSVGDGDINWLSANISDINRIHNMGFNWPTVQRIIDLRNLLSARAFGIGIKLLRPSSN